MIIHCKYDSLVSPNELKPHPKNRNRHDDAQIERLAKMLNDQGMRAPIVVSKQSGYIVKGHGTLMALRTMSADPVPVVYQDFADTDTEYRFVQGDNAIASWAELDLASINADLAELGPFDIDLLGIKDFVIEPAEKFGDGGPVPTMADKFMIPPFSVLNAREGWWQDRKRQWIAIGIKSEFGRGGAGLSSTRESGKTLGAIAPNQNDIMGRNGKYA